MNYGKFTVYLLCVASVIYGTPTATYKWKSLVFILPNDILPTGTSCKQFSNFYCLSAFRTDPLESAVTTGNQNPSAATDEDLAEVAANFSVLIHMKWKRINMFDFFNCDGCCRGQVDKYMQYGYHNQRVSPESYMYQLTDYSENKQLNYILASYLSDICLNLIVEIGFGVGPLRVHWQGKKMPRVDFVIITKQNKTDQEMMLMSHSLQPSIKFQQFKEDIMCKDQDWICAEERRRRDEARANQEMKKRVEAKVEEERRKIEEARQKRMEEARKIKEKREEQKDKVIEEWEKAQTEAARKKEELKKLEEEEARKKEELKKLEEERRIEKERKKEETKKLEEERRTEKARKKEEMKKLEEQRRTEKARKKEETKKLEEERRIEKARKNEEMKKLEEERRTEKARKKEEMIKLKEERRTEKARRKETRKLEEARNEEFARKKGDSYETQKTTSPGEIQREEEIHCRETNNEEKAKIGESSETSENIQNNQRVNQKETDVDNYKRTKSSMEANCEAAKHLCVNIEKP